MLGKEPNPGLERVRFELRADGARQQEANPLRTGTHTRGYLPHVKREGADYFVTYRLADSLPKEVLLSLERRRAEQLSKLHQIGTAASANGAEVDRINREYRRELERFLDAGHGACHLRRPEIAELVASNLQYFNEQRYILREWVIMPNHVHVIVWPMPNFTLSQILKTWKQFTSKRARMLLNLHTEHFWQPESYDHWVRDEEEYARIAGYIRNNPVKAQLCQSAEEWRWSSAAGRKFA